MAEEAGRLPIPKTQQGQELPVLGSLSLAKGVDESGLQHIVLAVGGGRQDDGFDFSRCGIVQSCDNMVELGQIHCDGWGASSLVPSLLTRRAPLSIAAAQKREPGTLCTRMREILLEIE